MQVNFPTHTFFVEPPRLDMATAPPTYPKLHLGEVRLKDAVTVSGSQRALKWIGTIGNFKLEEAGNSLGFDLN